MAEPRVSLVVAAKDLATRTLDTVKAKVKGWAGEVRSTVSSAVSGINGVLASVGVGISFAAITALTKRAVDEAAGAQAATERLRGAVGNLGVDFDRLAPKIDATVDRLAAMAAKDDDEVSDALANLVTKTRDLTGSLENLPLALDIAAKEQIDLQAATDLVAKAMNGQTRAFKELGITTGTQAEKMAQLRAAYAGFAEREGTSFIGLQHRIENGWNNLLEAVGTAIIRNEDLRSSLQSVAEWLEGTSQNMTGLDKAMFVVTSTAKILWGVLKSTVLLGFAPIVTVALTVSSALRGLALVFINLGEIAARAANLVIRGLNAMERGAALLQRREAQLLPEIDVSRFERWRRDTEDQINKNAEFIVGAWTAAGEAIGEAAATVSLVNEKGAVIDAGGNPNATVPRRTPKRTPPPAGSDDKADEKAARALDQRITLLAKAAETERGRAAALAELAKLEGELTAKLDVGNLTLQEEAKLVTQLRAVQEAQDAARRKELDLLLAGAELRDRNSAAIATLTAREQQLIALVREGTDAAARRAAATRELEAVEAQLADARARASGAAGGLAPDPDEVARLTARERELTEQIRLLGVVERDGTKSAAELAAVRKKLSDATSAFDGASLTRLVELEAEMAAALERERAAIAAGNGERRRQIELEKELARVREEIEKRTGRGSEKPKVTDGTTVIEDGERVAGAPRPRDRIDVKPGQLPAQPSVPEGIVIGELPVPEEPGFLREIEAAWQRIRQRIAEATAEQRTFGESIGAVAGAGFEGLVAAAEAAFAHIGGSSRDLGRAVSQALRGGVAEAAKEQGRFYFNKAIAALGDALLNPAHAGPALAAAAKYSLAAAGFFALGNAAGGRAGGAGGGGGGAGSGAGGGFAPTSQEREGARRVVYLQMPTGRQTYDFNDPDEVEAFRRFWENLTGSDVIVLPTPR